MVEIKKDIYISLVLLGVSLFFLYQSITIPKSSAYFPVAILTLLGISAIMLLVSSIIKYRQVKSKRTKANASEEQMKNIKSFKILLIIGSIIFYIIIQKWVGFLIATILTFNIIVFLSEYPLNKRYFAFAISIVVSIVVYFVFKKGLNIPLPTGMIFK